MTKLLQKRTSLKAIKYVKNNKSPGEDKLIYEYICSSVDCMIEIYVHLLNLVFDTGFFTRGFVNWKYYTNI